VGGILGIHSPQPIAAAGLVYLGLYALQHRGQESAGMAVADNGTIRIHKGMGMVANVFDDRHLAGLPGRIAIGHTRYGKSEATYPIGIHPLSAITKYGQIAIACNGNLLNPASLRRRLLQKGSVFQTATDSEVILNLIAKGEEANLEDAVAGVIPQLRGAYAAVLLSHGKLLAFRDPYGVRPLVLGKLGEAYVVASETAALDSIGAVYERECRPGELVIISDKGLESRQVVTLDRPAFCVFEYVYLARPDSNIGQQNVHLIRKEIGRVLAREAKVEADLVIPAPESANSAAMGYAEESGIPFDFGLMKNRYVGRTFIQPTQDLRRQGVSMKFNAVRAILSGKRVVLVEDSIVRGTTTSQAVQMIRNGGAKEVHLMIAAPPFTHPCHYGIDVPREGELIASGRTSDEVAALIGADTLHYISPAGLCRAVGRVMKELCLACFSGEYPAGLPESGDQAAMPPGEFEKEKERGR